MPDARFCHKCGRPVREEDRAYEQQVAAEIAPPPLPASNTDDTATVPPPAQPEIGFQNKVAVRIAALLAGPMYVLINLLAILPGGVLLAFAGLFGTGVISVAMYRQRTGTGVSVISGARMGWICGVFVFVIALVILTLVSALSPSGDLSDTMKEQLKRQGQNAAEVQRVTEFLQNPLAMVMLLATFFVMLTTIPSLGGAAGAALFQNNRN
ncbi:hypothetical protein F183_A19010 [Bryobacterales bacterium F-183]|nr:hypothetical protein F183_A19010 [Bryobacterales bacterium F-183]